MVEIRRREGIVLADLDPTATIIVVEMVVTAVDVNVPLAGAARGTCSWL